MNEISIGVTSEAQAVVNWLASFEAALAVGTDAALRRVFWDQEVHWRDLMAFTWTITPHDNPDAAVADLVSTQPKIKARNFRFAAGPHCTTPGRAARRAVDRGVLFVRDRNSAVQRYRAAGRGRAGQSLGFWQPSWMS